MFVPNRYKDRVAVITGAASGIGLATAKRIAEEGGAVVLVDRDARRLEEASRTLRSAGASGVLAQECDVSVESQVESCMKNAFDQFKHIDLIVNNAGRMIFKSIEEQSVEDWQSIFAVDLLGAFIFTKCGFRLMKTGSSIVNVSSIHALETTPNVASYAAAKAALVSLTRSAALEGKEKGIRVNAVMPGAVSTPMLWENPNIKAGLETIKMSDVGQPEDLAAVIAFLGCDDAKFIQGEAIRVDGGRLAHL